MTYAHDLFLDLDFDRTAFAAAVEDIRTLFRRTELPVVGLSGRPGTQPRLDDDCIGFNGINYDCTCDPGAPDYHDLLPCPPLARCSPVYPRNDGGDYGVGFRMDLTPPEQTRHNLVFEGKLWFEFSTRRRAYDQAVMLALAALKHHLGDQAEIHSKAAWWMWEASNIVLFAWGAGWSSSSVVSMYKHVFPDRAPVRNILTCEGDGVG